MKMKETTKLKRKIKKVIEQKRKETPKLLTSEEIFWILILIAGGITATLLSLLIVWKLYF